MVTEILRMLQALLHMIGMACLLWGTFCLIAAVWGQRGPINFVKGAGLLLLGVYLVRLMRVV